MEKQSIWNRNFIKLCLGSFFLFMNFYILATTLPMFILRELHGDQKQIGLAMTAFIIAAVVFRPFTGQWVDRFGKGKVTLISLMIFLSASLLYLGIESLPMLILLRCFHGIGFGMSSTAAGAVAADLVPRERLGEGTGYYSMFMSLAMVFGPFLGLTIATNYNFTMLFLICSGFSLLSILFVSTITFPETISTTAPRTQQSPHWRILIEPSALPVSMAGFVIAVAYSGILTFISVYANDLNIAPMANYFFICMAVMIVLPRPFIGKVVDRYGENVLVYPAIVLFALGMLTLSQAYTSSVFLLSGALIGFGYGGLLPCLQTLAVKSAPPYKTGLAVSTYFLLFDSGFGLGSYSLGILATHTSYHAMYFFSSILVLFTAFVYYRLHHRPQRIKDTVTECP